MKLDQTLKKDFVEPAWSAEGGVGFYDLLIKEVIDYAIIALDAEGNIKSWNEGAERIKGYSGKEIIGRNASVFYTEEDRKKKKFQHLLEIAKTRGRVEDEGWRLRKNGDRFWANMVITALHDDTGGLVGFAKITRDLTERKKLEQMKIDFVSFASHQLKTPLVEIYGFIEGLLRGPLGKLNEKQTRYLRMAENVANEALQLVADLLNISRIERGLAWVNLQPVRLRQMVEDAVAPYLREMESKRLKFIMEELDKNVTVICDYQKAVEAFKNVIHNAVKFTDRGTISICIGKKNGKGIIRISDTGIGISDEILKRLFTREYILGDTTNQRGGSGLGLYIAKSFLTLQSGEITADSAPGKGAAFTVTLPEGKLP